MWILQERGYIGIDNFAGSASQCVTQQGPDIIADLSSGPIPFPDESVDEVHSCHFIEHSPVDHILRESFRVLKGNGIFVAVLPWGLSSPGLYPGHNSFYTDQWWRECKLVSDLFVITEFRYRMSTFYQGLPAAVTALFPFDIAKHTLMNACDEFVVVAHPLKGYWPRDLRATEPTYKAK